LAEKPVGWWFLKAQATKCPRIETWGNGTSGTSLARSMDGSGMIPRHNSIFPLFQLPSAREEFNSETIINC
jgi:hypothetical protein